jgi:ATP-dependent Clp protease ATP-binding subunit ClpA
MKNDVTALIELKTGIPAGDFKAGEQKKLMDLEKILHERIVGQKEAVDAISNALRRARSGITNPNRPIGSFLFLGPTGVGKTETTKALAQVFFGSEKNVLRLDMSEFKSDDAVDKLIGSFDSGRPGILSSMVREKPYGVLLLDEFEKTSRQVLDLFLQVLDEGFFSDMHGKKVMMRNLIIIATSNAGSDMIWDFMRSGGGDLETHKGEIIDEIVKQGLFKPELLNRFDGVVLFHPIGDSDLRLIAKIMLERLKARLDEKGIGLVINDDLISYLVRFGADPKFGARPMNRAIQDKVEQAIADKIIKGEIKPGMDVALTATDLA